MASAPLIPPDPVAARVQALHKRAVLRERLLPPPSCPLPPGYFQAILAGHPTPPHPAANSPLAPAPLPTSRLRGFWHQIRSWLPPFRERIQPSQPR